ncbi:MAG: DUF2189 domain-containing protein, partial [Paracoccaceae bacterium]
DMVLPGVLVLSGLVMAYITWITGTTFWLVLAVLGFPLLGALTALGLYKTSRHRATGAPLQLRDILDMIWGQRLGQLPWLVTIIILIFLFGFFLDHMIFALFLGLAPMTNVSSAFGILKTLPGLQMLGFGTLIGAVFALLVFSISILSMPIIFARKIDFVTAMITSLSAERNALFSDLVSGALTAVIALVSMLPAFLGLFITMPALGHATRHLYQQVMPD